MAHGEANENFIDQYIEQIGFGRFQHLVLTLLFARTYAGASMLSQQAILEPFLRCEMELTTLQASWTVTAAFLMMIFSSAYIGKLSDMFGRQSVLLLAFVLHVFFSLLSSLSSSITMFIIARAAVGAVFPTRPAIIPYTLEVLPVSKRSILSAAKIFHSLGSIFGMLVGMLVLNYLSWRWFIVIAECIPSLMCVCLVMLLPESPRYLFSMNRKDEAVTVLKAMSKINGKAWMKLPAEGSRNVSGSNAGQSQLNRTVVLKITVTSFFSFTGALYGSTVELGTMQFGEGSNRGSCGDCTSTLTFKYRWGMEFAIALSFVITFVVISKVKRILAFRIQTVVLALSIIPFYWNIKGWALMLMIILSVTIVASFSICAIVYQAELVPTTNRSFAVGIATSSSYVGSFIGGFLSLDIYHKNRFICFGVIHGIILLAVIAAFCLPWETKDKPLVDT